MTTIATWNLHHMGREIGIPDGVTAVIAHVRPDVLVLTEYVDRGGREAFETAVVVSSGSFQYVEDCQVCCQPIELAGEVDDGGRLVGFTVSRSG